MITSVNRSFSEELRLSRLGGKRFLPFVQLSGVLRRSWMLSDVTDQRTSQCGRQRLAAPIVSPTFEGVGSDQMCLTSMVQQVIITEKLYCLYIVILCSDKLCL